MAETTQLKVSRNLTLAITDGTRSYSPRLDTGVATITAGGRATVRARDSAGDFVGPARAGEANVSTIELDVAMFGAGANASDPAAVDFAWLCGLVSSTWTTTESGSDADTKAFTVTLTQAASGGVDGATWALSDCIVRPGGKVTTARDGHRVALVFESPNPYPTVTTVAA